MGIASSNTSSNGLLFAYDFLSTKSLVGPPIQNKLLTLTTQGLGSSTYYDATGGEETVYIPTVGETTAKYVLIKNDYNSGSNNCCPSLFGYGNGIPVTGNTVYTYAILYRTTSGYTNGNFMYHYEYNSTGGYLTEYGLHDDNKRVHLGGGWYWAWNTFTSNAAAVTFNCAYFYYKYSTLAYDKLWVAKVMLVQGDYSGLHPKYWPAVNTTRSTSQMVRNVTSNTTINGQLTFSTNGSPYFNGPASQDQLNVTESYSHRPGNSFTYECWVKQIDDNGVDKILVGKPGGHTGLMVWSGNWHFRLNAGGTFYDLYTPVSYNTWTHLVGTYTAGIGMSFYKNGELVSTNSFSTALNDYGTILHIGGNVGWAAAYSLHGYMDQVKVYNRVIPVNEIKQNFNSQRNRYGV